MFLTVGIVLIALAALVYLIVRRNKNSTSAVTTSVGPANPPVSQPHTPKHSNDDSPDKNIRL